MAEINRFLPQYARTTGVENMDFDSLSHVQTEGYFNSLKGDEVSREDLKYKKDKTFRRKLPNGGGFETVTVKANDYIKYTDRDGNVKTRQHVKYAMNAKLTDGTFIKHNHTITKTLLEFCVSVPKPAGLVSAKRTLSILSRNNAYLHISPRRPDDACYE